MRNQLRMLICLLLCLALTGCTASPSAKPDATLPPAASAPDAPIGDAGLQHDTIVPLYLPSHDGQSLLTFYGQLTLSHDQHPAETILRTLLSYPGNSRVQPLGGTHALALSGATPVEISGNVCTVNLSASAFLLSSQELYTAALAIAATLCELEDIDYVNLLVSGSPVALDVGGNLPLGALNSQLDQELPVLWEQMTSRRTPVGELASATPLTATASLYFPLADGSGIVAEPRRLSFPGQHPQQMVITLLEALSGGADIVQGVCDLPNLSSLQLFMPEITELESGGRRVTLHFSSDAVRRISAAGCDPTCAFAAITTTLTTFVPSLQQVCILTGDGALTSLFNEQLGSMLFPGGLLTRQDFAHTLMGQATVYVPKDTRLSPLSLPLPYRSAVSPRALLLAMSSPAVAALPERLTDADILGLSVQNDTLLVNFSARYGEIIRDSALDQRLVAYSMVNTLCERLQLRRVRFYFGGEAIESLGSDLAWNGEFFYNPGMTTP